MKKLVPLFVLLSAALASAQSPSSFAVGLHWSGSSGASAGTICDTPSSCPAFSVNVAGGESVAISVRGAPDGEFIIGTSSGASQCVSVAGVYNALALDAPIDIAVVGALSAVDSNLSCPGGLAEFSGPFPAGMPAGVSVAIQAVAIDPQGRIVFTPAIVVTTA